MTEIKPEFKQKWLEQDMKPNWCPGCGNFSLLKALTMALAELELNPENVVIASGIGCSSNFPHFTPAYGLHAVHGRALPAATGVHMSNPHELKVIAVGGDGDGYGIGLNHFIHSCRRNLNMTYLVMNNQIYGMTKGQSSPTSQIGHVTATSPEGVNVPPVNPITLAISAGATFVGRGYSGNPSHLQELILKAVNHEGFAFVDVLSPCVSMNKLNTLKWYKERVYELEETNHDIKNRAAALTKGLEWGEKIPIGVYYQTKDLLPMHKVDPVTKENNPSKTPLGFKAMGIPPEEVFKEFK